MFFFLLVYNESGRVEALHAAFEFFLQLMLLDRGYVEFLLQFVEFGHKSWQVLGCQRL